MKLIHTADIHLGSKIDSRFPSVIAAKRREELRATFKRMAEYAMANGVGAIILAGDVFDSDSPSMKDREFFYSVVKNTPSVDFLYLKGNHDSSGYGGEDLPNLKTFGDGWTYYRYGNLVIAGTELTGENYSSVYSSLSLGKEDLNVAVMHGQAGESYGKDRVNLKKLRDKNVDYLALGHIHKPQRGKLDDRGEYAYCGCPEGRGFDETGKHGFMLLETGDKITAAFVPFACRTIEEKDADVSGARDGYECYLAVKRQIEFNRSWIYRINLTGELDAEADISAADVAAYLKDSCFFADVKDKTERKIDWEKYKGDLSVRGEFVRAVFNGEGTEDEKRKIAAIGLKALEGRDIEL